MGDELVVADNVLTTWRKCLFQKIGRILLPCRRRFHRTLSFEAMLERIEGVGENVEVRDAGIKGKGVFATKLIRKGENLGKYRGRIMTPEELLERYPDNNSPYAFQVIPGLFIDSNDDDVDLGITNYTRYINHSKFAPNVTHIWRPSVMYPKGAVIFEAAKDIQPGEELTFDYGDGYWIGREAPLEDTIRPEDIDCEAAVVAAVPTPLAAGISRVAVLEDSGTEAATEDEDVTMQRPLLLR